MSCWTREIRQPRDLAGLRGSRLERGGDDIKSPLRPQRCDTCHPGAGAQGPNRHEYCTQPLPSRRQGHERNLPSLAAEPQLLPGPPGSLVLSANLQVLRGCLPTCSSRSLRGFSGQPSGLATRPSAWCLKQRNIRWTGQEYQGLLPGLTSCLDTARWNKLAVRFLREMRRSRKRFIASRG